MLDTLLSHGLRRTELYALRLVDLQEHRFVEHLCALSRGRKIRLVPLRPVTGGAIVTHLEATDHGDDESTPLFYSTSSNARAKLVMKDCLNDVLSKYASMMGIDIDNRGRHALRSTAIVNSIQHGADLEKVQDWVSDVNIATTRKCGRRKHRVEGSPTFKVSY